MRFAPTLDPASSPAPAAMSVPADTSAVPVAPSLGRRPLPAWVGAFGLTLGQGALALGLALFLALPLVAIPVSYTHLDVYKRQTPGRSATVSIR